MKNMFDLAKVVSKRCQKSPNLARNLARPKNLELAQLQDQSSVHHRADRSRNKSCGRNQREKRPSNFGFSGDTLQFSLQRHCVFGVYWKPLPFCWFCFQGRWWYSFKIGFKPSYTFFFESFKGWISKNLKKSLKIWKKKSKSSKIRKITQKPSVVWSLSRNRFVNRSQNTFCRNKSTSRNHSRPTFLEHRTSQLGSSRWRWQMLLKGRSFFHTMMFMLESLLKMLANSNKNSF